MRNLVISVKPEYEPGEHIEATAEGNPPPLFEWNKLTGGGQASVPGNRLTITSSMEGNNMYRCDVTNTLVNGNVIKANKTINFIVICNIFFCVKKEYHLHFYNFVLIRTYEFINICLYSYSFLQSFISCFAK